MSHEQIGQTISSVFETLYRKHRLCGKSPQSVENHRINIRHFERYLREEGERNGKPWEPKQEALLSDLTDDNLLGAMQRLLDLGRAPATANKLRVAISAVWNFAARKGLVATWPDVRPIHVPEKSPQAWNQPQIYRLFLALETIPKRQQIGGLPMREWLVAFHMVLWDTGERLTATRMIRIADIDLETGWLLIRAANRKGQTRDTRHRLHVDTMIRVRRFVALQPDREFLFPLDCCLGTLFNRYRAILKGAGLAHGKESMFHRMRRSVLSHFKVAGGNSTRLADHSSAETTRKSYEDPTIVVEPQASDFLFRPFPGENPEPPRAA